jgi:hypothetical protein
MNGKESSEELNECLEQLLAGIPIDRILTEYPARAADLRPLLEAAAHMRQPSTNLPALPEAQARSRAIFLAESASLDPKTRRNRSRLSFRFRLTGSVVLMMGFLMAITGLASANSLPGEQLYPLKLAIEQAQIGLTSDPATRLHMQQSFEQQRAGEVSALIQQGRSQQVTFYGFVAVPKKGTVEVGGLPVTLPPEQVNSISKLAGSYVVVTGKTISKGVIAIGKVHLNTTQLDGTIQSMQGNNWKVDDLEVIVNAETEIQGKPKTGQHVYINATRLSDGKLMAVAINLDQPDANQESSEILASPDQTTEPHSAEQLEAATPTRTQPVLPSPTKRVQPTEVPTNKVKLTPTKKVTPADTLTARPTPSETASPTPSTPVIPTSGKKVSPTSGQKDRRSFVETITPTPTPIVRPTPVKKALPTVTRQDTALPTPKDTQVPSQHKLQTSPTNNAGVQEENQEPAVQERNERLNSSPTPTPISPGKNRHNSSLISTPTDNAGPFIQSADPQNASQASPSPSDNCVMTPENPVGQSETGLPLDTQTSNRGCSP